MVMLPRTRRHTTWALSTACASLSLLTIFLAWHTPMGCAPSTSTPLPSDIHFANFSKRPDVAAFEPLLKQELRRSLYDPLPAAPVVPQASKPPLTVRLAGTIIEPGHCKAMLITSDGRIELRGVGQKSRDVEVLSIEEKKVTVRFNGDTLELKTQEKDRR